MIGLHTRHRTVIVIGGVALVAVALSLAVSSSSDIFDGDPSPPVATNRGEPDEPPPTSPSAEPDDPAPPATPSARPAPDTTTGRHAARPDPLPDTDDPDTYAAAVAAALHSIDHTRERPADYEALFADAVWDEIVPEARAAILDAIYARLPGERMWHQQTAVAQRAEFTVDEVFEPALGRQGRDEQWWPAGVVVRTVTGTVIETWQPPDTTEPRSASRSAAVTVVVACPPATSPCRLVGIQPGVEA